MKKISVIVPVYNVERFLAKCLDSLVNQTLDEIEIICVDDGSTDGSGKILVEYAQKFPEKVKFFTKENGGLSDARNYGIDRAVGEFLAFVDSDDFVLPHMFEEMYSLAKKHGAEMAICNIQKVDENGMVTQKLPQLAGFPEKIDLAENFSVFSDISYFACNKIFRKDLFENKRFKRGVHFEDIDLIPRILLECKTLAQTQTFHYQYLERADSITKTHTARGLDVLKAVETVEDAFEKSVYKNKKTELKNFQILEGVYSFLAYWAFVKDDKLSVQMSRALQDFIKKRGIKLKEILRYRRFGKNYLVSLPPKKQIFYLLYFFNREKLIRKLLK